MLLEGLLHEPLERFPAILRRIVTLLQQVDDARGSLRCGFRCY